MGINAEYMGNYLINKNFHMKTFIATILAIAVIAAEAEKKDAAKPAAAAKQITDKVPLRPAPMPRPRPTNLAPKLSRPRPPLAKRRKTASRPPPTNPSPAWPPVL